MVVNKVDFTTKKVVNKNKRDTNVLLQVYVPKQLFFKITEIEGDFTTRSAAVQHILVLGLEKRLRTLGGV